MSNPIPPSFPETYSPSIPNFPVSQLESLKFKANQIIESIQALQWTIEAGGNPGAMHAWPDILSKYNILLSQTHNFSNALVSQIPIQSARMNGVAAHGTVTTNIYERIAVHPAMGMPDAQLDSEIIPLLRNQQTTDVLRMENETVRRLAGHMSTKGSLGVLGPPQTQTSSINTTGLGYAGFSGHPKKVTYEDVIRECAEIRGAHDHRVERAVRAVLMLREKFDWKQRVEVEVEEPEELDWDPRVYRDTTINQAQHTEDGDVGMESADEEKGGSSDEDEVNVEGELVAQGDMEQPSPPPADPSMINPPSTNGLLFGSGEAE